MYINDFAKPKNANKSFLILFLISNLLGYIAPVTGFKTSLYWCVCAFIQYTSLWDWQLTRKCRQISVALATAQDFLLQVFPFYFTCML